MGLVLLRGRGDVVEHGERGTEVDLLLGHGLDARLVQHLSVLDAVHPGGEGDGVPGGGDAVGGHLAPGAVGLVDDGLQLFLGEVGEAADLAVGLLEVPAVGVDLDPVRPLGDLIAHRPAAPIGAVAQLDALGPGELPAEGRPAHAVGPGGGEGPGGHEEARADDDSCRFRSTQVDVGESGPLVSDVPEGGEAVVQGDAHRLGGPQGAVDGGLLEDLVVVLLLGGVALDQHVGVGVDESG